MLRSFWKHRVLIRRLTVRQVVGRYRGSMFGLLWSFLNPLLMLAVYTFVFSQVFSARWSIDDANPSSFALALFSGLIVYGFFSEILNSSTTLIIENSGYVKRVVFPLEILSCVSVLTAGFHALISLLVWGGAFLWFKGDASITWLAIVPIFVPLALFCMGLSWFCASLAVYFRDLGQIMAVLTSGLLFLSPIFYSVDKLPEKYQEFLYWNPLTYFIEEARMVLIYGNWPDWVTLAIVTLLCWVVAQLGLSWFNKTRVGFSDVL